MNIIEQLLILYGLIILHLFASVHNLKFVFHVSGVAFFIVLINLFLTLFPISL